MMDAPAYMTTKQAARVVGFSHRTLEGQRMKGVGPRFLRLDNGRIRYRKEDLIQWLENGCASVTI